MADSMSFGTISHGQMSFHNWLIQSRYVNGGDDAQGRRRKGKARSTKGEEHDPRHVQAHTNAVLASSLMLPPDALPLSGKRKARRWMNDRLLKDMAGPLNPSDITSLYAPPPWGEKTERPVLERLSDVALSTPFEAFVCQQYLAGATFNKLPSRKSVNKSRHKQPPGGAAGTAPESAAAAAASAAAAAVAASQVAWKRVPGAARGAIRRAADWVVVSSLESLLVSFLQPPTATTATGTAAIASCTTAAGAAEGAACAATGDVVSEDGTKEESSMVAAPAAPVAAVLSGDSADERSHETEEEQALGERKDEGMRSEQEGMGSVLPEWCLQAAWGDVESALGAHGVKGRAAENGDLGVNSTAEGGVETGVAGGSRGGGGEGVLVFAADDAFLRLLLHGMCQFHGMRSHSLPAAHLPPHLLLSFPPHLAPSTITIAWLPATLPSHSHTVPPLSQAQPSASQGSESPTAAAQANEPEAAAAPAAELPSLPPQPTPPSHPIRLHHILPTCPLPLLV